MQCAMGALHSASFFTLEITLELRSRYEGLDECHHRLLKAPLLLEDTHTHTHTHTHTSTNMYIQ